MTKKHAIIVIIITVLTTTFSLESSAQDKFNASISMGKILPLGKFKSMNNNSLNAGFSESGFSLIFDGNYSINNRLSVTARINFGMTAMNEAKVQNWLESNMFDYLSEKEDNNVYSVDYWQWTAPMVGFKYNYPIVINKVYIETGAYSGISIIQTPEQNLKITSEEYNKIIFSENIKSTSISVPIMLDAGCRIVLNDKIQLELKSSYFQTKAKYEHVDYITHENATTIDEEISKKTFDIPVKTININIGVVYKL